MNQPNIQDLPSREDVVEMAEAQQMLAYEGTKRVLPAGDNRLRCAVCDAPSGEVTLMKVEARGQTGYVCFGGDCAGQRNTAIGRMFRRAAGIIVPTRLTASGKAMVWNQKGERSYELTSREVKRRRNVRGIQRASRRANRSK